VFWRLIWLIVDDGDVGDIVTGWLWISVDTIVVVLVRGVSRLGFGGGCHFCCANRLVFLPIVFPYFLATVKRFYVS
jgi:hypothetical protein